MVSAYRISSGHRRGDQIREVLIHANYLSQKDVEICRGFDINTLATEADFPAIKALFDAFAALYPAEEA